MIANTMQYKNYYGSVNYSPEDDILHGKLLGIKSLVSYEGRSIDELKKAFEEAVNDYLELCVEDGITPEVSDKEDIQLRAALKSKVEKMSSDKFIELDLKEDKPKQKELTFKIQDCNYRSSLKKGINRTAIVVFTDKDFEDAFPTGINGHLFTEWHTKK